MLRSWVASRDISNAPEVHATSGFPGFMAHVALRHSSLSFSPSYGIAMKSKRTSVMLGALCLAAASLAMHTQFASAETTLQRIQRTGEVRIGYANEAPFAYTQPDGKVTGESPEISRKIFEKLGVKKVDAVLTEWGSLIPGLRAGRFDVIAAG